jgi:hypothetical protein
MRHLFSRRTCLRVAFSAGLAWPLSASAKGIQYSVAVHPTRALVGEHIVAVLTCAAVGDSVDAVTLDDGGLVLKLERLPRDPDPAVTFPNHWGVQRGDTIKRMSTGSRSQRLRGGQRVTRTFDLLESFSEMIFDTGDYSFSYEIEGYRKAIRAAPAKLTIQSSPAAVEPLFDLLDSESLELRSGAADLLLRMTAHTAGYAPAAEVAERQQALRRWRQWWNTIGQKLPWSFTTTGAVFGGSIAPAPRGRRSKSIGGVQYERRVLDPASGKAMAAAVAEWLRDKAGGLGPLAGRVWVADLVFTYPPENAVIDPGEEAVMGLQSALQRLAQLAAAGSAGSPAATMLLATVARIPDARFVGPLAELQSRADKNPGWRGVSAIASDLLVVLDLGRSQKGD